MLAEVRWWPSVDCRLQAKHQPPVSSDGAASEAWHWAGLASLTSHDRVSSSLLSSLQTRPHCSTAALSLYDDLFTVTCNQCLGGLSLKECTDTVLSLAMVVVTRPAPAPMHYNYTNQLRLRCLRQAVLARMTLKTDYSCDQTSVTFVHLFRLRFDTFNSWYGREMTGRRGVS